MVQGLRFHTPNAGGLARELEHLRVCMPQLRPGAAKYINKTNKCFFFKKEDTALWKARDCHLHERSFIQSFTKLVP